MVLKTNTRNSLVDDVYDVLISVSCAAAFKLVLGLWLWYVLGGTARGLEKRDPKRVQEGTCRDVFVLIHSCYM
jgi:hypothetical protein